MHIKILDVSRKKLIDAEILPAKKMTMPLKKDGWNFNWRTIAREEGTQTYGLSVVQDNTIQGVLHLKEVGGMLIMDIVEIAPHNIGGDKIYDYVTGCLIAFACRESFKIDGNYKGFLVFVSKTDLIEWYISKYGAEVAIGPRMFIAPENGRNLMTQYLDRK